MADVLPSQIGEVDEGEAPRAEAEDEGVAGEGQFTQHPLEGFPLRVVSQPDETVSDVEGGDAPDQLGRYGPFLGMGDGGGDVRKGTPVGDQPLSHGLVVDGMEVAHVEHGGVPGHSSVGEPLPVAGEDFLADLRQRDVVHVEGGEEPAEAMSAVTVVLCQS